MSRKSTSKEKRNVGQAVVANEPARRNRKQEGSGKNDRIGKGVAGKGISSSAAATKNDNSSTKGGERKYDAMRNKCHRCLEPGHRWYDCTTHVIRAAERSHEGSGEVIACLTIGMIGTSGAVGGPEQSKDGTEKWIAHGNATFHMTRSTDLLRDLHPTEDKVKIGDDTLIGVEGYGSLTVAFPNKEGGVTVRLEKEAHVSHLAFKRFSFMAAHKRGVGFVTDDGDMSATLADGRLMFWSDGSGSSDFGRTD